MEDVQHTRYHHEDQGHYNWHIDTFWDNRMTLYDRKISVIRVILSIEMALSD